MKRQLMLLLLCLMFVTGAYAQDKRVTIHRDNAEIVQVMNDIESQTDYLFVYGQEVNVKTLKSVQADNQKVSTVLNHLFAGTNIGYELKGKHIILSKKTATQNGNTAPNQSTTTTNKKKITGKVVDNNGDPVIGATIMENGTSNGTVTDIDGNFSLDVSEGATVKVSYIGHVPQTLKATGSKPLNISLQEDLNNLDEVVVIGYGTAKRRDFTGSVASVKMEDSPISLGSNTNGLEAVKGAITGLDVGYSNSAGTSPGIQIRGQNSISGSNTPLIVVDGIIYTGSLNDINPDDIASFDVLKDASSVAVYGSRSANGVVAITTKKGKQGKPKFSFSMKNSLEMWACKPDLMTAQQWLESTMARNNYEDASFLTGQQLDNYNNGISTDWFDFVTRTGHSQDYQASVSGANDRFNYYLSAAYTGDKGIVKGDDYDRITIKAKFDTDVNSWLKIGLDASYARADYSGVGASLWSVQQMSPYGMPYRGDGSGLLEKYPNGTNEAVNPLWGVDDGTRDNTDIRNNFRLNAFGEIKFPFLKGLSYRMNYSTTLDFANSSNFTHESYYTYVGPYDDADRYSATTQKNYLASTNGNDDNSRTASWVLDNILSYSNRFGKHFVDATAVATRDRTNYKWKRATGSDFSSNGNTLLGVDGLPFATTQKLSNDATRTTNIGYLIRGAYNYDNTYYFTATYRRDGASVFGANTKWGNFGAVGGAWRITNEPFMKKLTFLNDLKLKVSWGRNGNQGISAYSTLSRVAAGSGGGIKVTFGNTGTVQYGINQSTIGNADLGWETTEAWNIGFESSWLNNRISLDVDVYFSKTFDQLFNRTIPVMSGFSSMLSSMGEVQNRGVEITLRTDNIQTKNFAWSSAFTFWLNRDKLTHLYGEDLDGDGKEDDDIANSLFIGKSIHSIYGMEQDGIVQETDVEYMEKNGVSAGTPKYVDYNGDGEINSDDRHIIGNTNPNFKLNMSNTLKFKDFEFYCMITGNFGGSGYYQASNKAAYIIGGSGDSFGVNSMYVPYWTPENKSNKYPAATYTGDSYFLGLQSRAFVRLQDISLSYTFNQPWFKHIGISNLRVFATGKNLLTFSGWEGGDPEIGNSIVSGTYPVMKSVSFGLNISF